nr:SRP72 RNA-binding domain-containing protein [Tanacetum cinerariifolium]
MLQKFSQIVNRLYAFIYKTNHSKSGLGFPSIVALVMVIHKSWTSLGKHEKGFYTGLKKFVDDCKPLVDSVGNIRCPCKSCRLVLWVSIKHLSKHISKYGFDPSYKTWIHHGKVDLPPPPPGPDGEMYYGQLEQILEFSYLSFKTVLFRVKWFDTSNKGHMTRRPPGWKVVKHVSHKKFLNGGVIVVKDDPHVIHVDNSSDLVLSTSLNDLKIAALHIDGQSIDVDAPPDIIDVVDEDDGIIDEEDPIPHDLADFDDEDPVNLDIDDGVNVPTGCGGCLGNRGKGTRKPNLGGRRAGRLHTRQETQNLRLKAITDNSGPVPIRFEVDDRETLMPLGDHGLPFLAPNATGAEGGGRGKDWESQPEYGGGSGSGGCGDDEPGDDEDDSEDEEDEDDS